jgi:hypothetical protein
MSVAFLIEPHPGFRTEHCHCVDIVLMLCRCVTTTGVESLEFTIFYVG